MNKNLEIIRTEIIRILHENGKIRGADLAKRVRYVHVEREKVSQMVIYTKRNIVYFAMEPEMPINTKIRLITKIKKITIAI